MSSETATTLGPVSRDHTGFFKIIYSFLKIFFSASTDFGENRTVIIFMIPSFLTYLLIYNYDLFIYNNNTIIANVGRFVPFCHKI